MYLVAIFCPPLAVLMCGKPFQAVVAFFLWLLLWIPGSIYACAIVAERNADRRNDELVRAVRGGRSRRRRDDDYD